MRQQSAIVGESPWQNVPETIDNTLKTLTPMAKEKTAFSLPMRTKQREIACLCHKASLLSEYHEVEARINRCVISSTCEGGGKFRLNMLQAILDPLLLPGQNVNALRRSDIRFNFGPVRLFQKKSSQLKLTGLIEPEDVADYSC